MYKKSTYPCGFVRFSTSGTPLIITMSSIQRSSDDQDNHPSVNTYKRSSEMNQTKLQQALRVVNELHVKSERSELSGSNPRLFHIFLSNTLVNNLSSSVSNLGQPIIKLCYNITINYYHQPKLLPSLITDLNVCISMLWLVAEQR